MSPTRFEVGSSSSKHKSGTKEKNGNEQGRRKRLRKSKIGSPISDSSESAPNIVEVEEDTNVIEAGLLLTSESFQPVKRRRKLILYDSDSDLDDDQEPTTSNPIQISVLPPSQSPPSPLHLVDTDVSSLEYMSNEDQAWYDVSLSLDAGNETLTVKHSCFPATDDVVFSVEDFRTPAQLKKLLARFRPISRPLQDNECNHLSVGTSVCASYTVGDDIRYYDAIVKKVERNAHSSAHGGEVCLCKFVLYWKRGPSRGTKSPAKIAGICALAPATEIHPTLHLFEEMVNRKLLYSNHRPLMLEANMQLQSLPCENEGLGMNSRYAEHSSNAEDMGHNSCNADGSATTDGHFVILLNNLEIDLTPSSIQDFLFENVALMPDACVFPRWQSQSFGSGAIMVDCLKKAQTIHEFLVNPKHMVVSSRGRPWVVTEEPPTRKSGTENWNFIPARQEEIIPIRTHKELKVVMFGSESYKKAQKLKRLFAEYLNNGSQLQEKLALEENKIRRELEVVPFGTESYRRAEQLRRLFTEYLNHGTKLQDKLALEENKILQSS